MKVFECVIPDCSYHFRIAVWRAKDAESTHMNPRNPIVAILAALSLSLVLADDFKTINGKEYKNVTVSRVEADGIVIKTKTGLSKIYFAELPKDVQERFHYGSSTPTGKAVTQSINEAESGKPPAAFLDAVESALQTANEKFVQRVEKSSTSGKRSYKGNTRPARQS